MTSTLTPRRYASVGWAPETMLNPFVEFLEKIITLTFQFRTDTPTSPTATLIIVSEC